MSETIIQSKSNSGADRVVTPRAVAPTPTVVESVADLGGLTIAAHDVVVVASYDGSGKRESGIYQGVPGDTSAVNGGTIIKGSAATGRWKLVNDGVVRVTQFGAVGDGVTDDSNAFIAARQWAESHGHVYSDIATDPCGQVVIEIPPGAYLLTVPEAMLTASAPSGKVGGLKFRGAGSNLSSLLYKPATTGQPMLHNHHWLSVAFEGLTFFGNDATADFLLSDDYYYDNTETSVQDYRFVDCVWNGAWRYVNNLIGKNNNSEWSWDRCGIGRITALTTFLYAGATNTSDQFVNFWFKNFKFWPSVGGWVDMARGGHIELVSCDVSGWAPTAPTYLFNLAGTSHAYGVCSFSAHGLRIEHKSDNALLMQCVWDQGDIVFDHLDQSSQVGLRAAGNEYFRLAPVNTAGPNVRFSSGQLLGCHRFVNSTTAYRFGQSIAYENCTLLQQPSGAQFALMSGASPNSGGLPSVHFANTRVSRDADADQKKIIVDSDLNWHLHYGGTTTHKLVTLAGPNSDAPITGGSLQFELPRDVVVTGVRFCKQAAGNGGAYAYDLQMGNGSTTAPVYSALLDTAGNPVVFSGASSLAASYQEAKCFFPVGSTDDTRVVRLVDAANRSLSFTNYYLVLEYIG